MLETINGGITPTRGSKYSAMVDLYAREDVVIGAGETKIVPLGVKIDIDKLDVDVSGDYKFARRNNASDETLIRIKEQQKDNFMKSHYLELHPRSSLRAKGLIVGVGICDLDYPDELGLIVHNPIRMVFVEPIECGDEYVDITLTGSNYGCSENVKSCGKITIKKGDKIAQCTLMGHKGYLLGIESDTERVGGFGSTGGIR